MFGLSLDPQKHHLLDRVFMHGASILEFELARIPTFICYRIACPPRNFHVDQLSNEEPHADGGGIFMQHGVAVGGWKDVWICVVLKYQ